MSIQIIITGDHATDALCELQTLAVALSPNQVTDTQCVPDIKELVEVNPARFTTGPSAGTPVEEKKPAASARFTAAQQNKAVKDMIEAGEINETFFGKLTKARQTEVEAALKEGSVNHDAPNDEEFADDVETPTELSIDVLRETMASVSKDAAGNPVTATLVKIRAILTEHMPADVEVKIGNLPEEKWQVVSDAMKALKA